jgi:hypothetical protein
MKLGDAWMMEMGMVYNIIMVCTGGYNRRDRERQQMIDRRRRERQREERIEARFRRLEDQAENKPMLPETQPTLPIGARRRTRRRKTHTRKTHKR